jgi:hypothetical protein
MRSTFKVLWCAFALLFIVGIVISLADDANALTRRERRNLRARCDVEVSKTIPSKIGNRKRRAALVRLCMEKGGRLD